MLTRTDRRRFPILLAVIAALAMAMLFSPVQAQEGSAPDKPRGLETTATHDSVTLTWDDPGDDTITGYVILRRIPGVDPQGQFSELVSNTGTDATTYTDDTVSAETRYTYRIKAINEHGVSERSRWFHIDVPAAPEAAEGDDPDGEDDGGGAPGGPGKRANVAEPSDGDCAAGASTTCEVDVGGSVTGNIGANGDRDWFKVVLEADKAYQIDLKGEDGGGGTLINPELLNIRDSEGDEIDDTGNNNIDDYNDLFDSQIIFTPTEAGTYYLVARDGDGPLTGTYTLSVGEVETEEPPCTLNEGDIWCGVMDVGDITNNSVTQSHGFQGTTGDLSDKTFSLMFETGTTNNYTITAIVVGATTANSEQLYFVTSSSLTDTEVESLALHVDGESDPFVWSDSTEVITGSYRWPARTDLDWSSETTVTLRLREFPRPTVTNVAVTSMPVLETDTYGAGETIEVSVTFSEAVDATSNTDFVLSVGGARRAPLLSGSGTATLVFGYTVVSSDEDTNGIWIGDETRTLVGNRNGEAQNGTITSVATGAAAVIAHTLLGTDSDHKVDGSRTTDNVAPAFTSSATFDAAENQTAAGTVLATDDDTDDSVTGYEITGGADQTFFSIGATSGVLTFDAAPNYEDAEDQGTNNTYVVDVTATSGTGTREMTATQTITVTVTDVDTEAPGKPAKPRVSAASVTSLRVNWSAPSNAGPAITDYDVQYRAGTSGAWSTKSHSGTATATTLTGLTEDTPYQVQVRAKNAEGTGAWSDSGSGTPAEEDDLPADTTTTGEVEVGGAAVRGDILAPVEETVTWTIINTEGEEEEKTGTVYDFDTDWFAVELEEGRTYRIDMEGAIHADADDLTLRLPQINAIYNEDGEFLVNTWSRDESDSHYLFRVTFHAHDDGTYYIAASGESHEWGTYELRVKDITEDDDEHTAAQRGLKNLRAVEEKGGVRLTWQPPDGAAVTGYRIERRRAGGQDSGPQRSHGQPRDHHTLVEDTGNTETSYVDESAEQGVEYEYRVTARNESGPGEESDWVRAGPASASNNPATGAPTISGTTQVGETLTADISGIADADGLSGETFTYQWVSSDGTTDTDIENATGSTYTLIAADQGKSVKVRVTFTDDGGNEETLTSAPTAPVWGDGLPGAPRNLTATPGNREVSLSWDPPDDNGNAPATRYRIEWRVDGQDYGTSQWGTSRETTYTTNDQANLANGVKYFFRVKAENGSGNSYGPYGPASEEVSATPTSGSAVDLGTPVLSDTETLHHGMVQLDWQDIEDAGWYVVQYYHLEDEEWLDLPAEGVDIAFHGSSAVVSNLHGGLHWLRVGAASCAGSSEWSQIEELYGTNASDWEGVPVPEVEEGDETEPCPVVLGTPVLSDTEILHHGMVQLDWQDIEDAGWYVVQYYHLEDEEWLDLPAEGVDIAFHGSSAVVSNLHGLSWLRVGAASCDGASEWSQIEESYGTNASDWKGVPVPEVAEGDEIEPCSEDADTPDNSPATGAPTISGTAQVGETLTANTSGVADGDGLSNVQYEYQWLADDADISGATNAIYTLVAADEGKAVKVQVSFTDDEGNEETLTSTATDAVAGAQPTEPPDKPTGLEATASHDSVTLTWDDPGDDSITGYVILRRVRVNNTGGEFSELVADTGTAATTYTDDTVAAGTTYTYRIKAINGAGTSERSRWFHIDTPAAPVPDKPTGLSATASHDAITLTWDDPGDDSITGYVILRRLRYDDPSGHFDELVADTGTAATTYTDDTVKANTSYTYRIKAINEHGGVSERSRWFHIQTPAAP